MQIVIDIPDKTYKVIKNTKQVSERECWILTNAILNGKSLSKGHGKLIDADYAIKQLLSLPKNELSTEDMWAMKVLDLAPTIIEADKLPNNELENPFNDSRFGG